MNPVLMIVIFFGRVRNLVPIETPIVKGCSAYPVCWPKGRDVRLNNVIFDGTEVPYISLCSPAPEATPESTLAPRVRHIFR